MLATHRIFFLFLLAISVVSLAFFWKVKRGEGFNPSVATDTIQLDFSASKEKQLTDLLNSIRRRTDNLDRKFKTLEKQAETLRTTTCDNYEFAKKMLMTESASKYKADGKTETEAQNAAKYDFRSKLIGYTVDNNTDFISCMAKDKTLEGFESEPLERKPSSEPCLSLASLQNLNRQVRTDIEAIEDIHSRLIGELDGTYASSIAFVGTELDKKWASIQDVKSDTEKFEKSSPEEQEKMLSESFVSLGGCVDKPADPAQPTPDPQEFVKLQGDAADYDVRLKKLEIGHDTVRATLDRISGVADKSIQTRKLINDYVNKTAASMPQ
jgi:hypothetical protein